MDFIKINNIYSSKGPIKSMRVGELINNLCNQNKRQISWTYKKNRSVGKKTIVIWTEDFYRNITKEGNQIVTI